MKKFQIAFNNLEKYKANSSTRN